MKNHLLSRTDLDVQTNVVVVGKHAEILIMLAGELRLVSFTLDYEYFSRPPIVESTIRCDCSFSGETFLLIVLNALSVLAMDHNLMPPFIIE